MNDNMRKPQYPKIFAESPRIVCGSYLSMIGSATIPEAIQGSRHS